MGTHRDAHQWAAVGRLHFECSRCGLHMAHLKRKYHYDPLKYLTDGKMVRVTGSHPHVCGTPLAEYGNAPPMKSPKELV